MEDDDYPKASEAHLAYMRAMDDAWHKRDKASRALWRKAQADKALSASERVRLKEIDDEG